MVKTVFVLLATGYTSWCFVEGASDDEEKLMAAGVKPTEILKSGQNYIEIAPTSRSHAEISDMRVIDYNKEADMGTVILYPSNRSTFSPEDAAKSMIILYLMRLYT